ncbi:uncharacterized protein LOC144110042 isoform X2 [Amblyomma americanum]
MSCVCRHRQEPNALAVYAFPVHLFISCGPAMPICAIIGCPIRSSSARRPGVGQPLGIGLFCLPKVITWQCERTRMLSEKRRALWFERINRRDLMNPKHLRVCGRHFITGRPSRLMDDKNPDWAPSLYLGYEPGEFCNCFQCLNKAKGKKVLAVVPGMSSCQSFLHDESLPVCCMDSRAARRSPTNAKAARRSSQKCCAVVGCNHSMRKRNLLLRETCSNHGTPRSSCMCGVYSLHRFPSMPESLHDWITALNRENYVPSKGSRVVVTRMHYVEDLELLPAAATSSEKHPEMDKVSNHGDSLRQITQELSPKYSEPKFGAHQTSVHTQCSDLDLFQLKRNTSTQVAIPLKCDATCQAEEMGKDATVQCRGLYDSVLVEHAYASVFEEVFC